MGDKRRQECREGGHTIQQRETRMGTCWEKRGDRETMGDKRRQDPREGGHTIQQKGNKKGYNERQEETRPSGRRTHHPTKGTKGNKKG